MDAEGSGSSRNHMLCRCRTSGLPPIPTHTGCRKSAAARGRGWVWGAQGQQVMVSGGVGAASWHACAARAPRAAPALRPHVCWPAAAALTRPGAVVYAPRKRRICKGECHGVRRQAGRQAGRQGERRGKACATTCAALGGRRAASRRSAPGAGTPPKGPPHLPTRSCRAAPTPQTVPRGSSGTAPAGPSGWHPSEAGWWRQGGRVGRGRQGQGEREGEWPELDPVLV